MSNERLLDLWPIYKVISQRQRLCKGSAREFFADRMKDAFSLMLTSPTLENANQFYGAELEWLGHPLTTRGAKNYGNSVVHAVRIGAVKVSRPAAIKTVGLGFDPVWGFVYLASSPIRPGEIKVGATTYDPKIRLSKFKHKFGEDVDLQRAWEVDFPARVERQAQDALREFRVSGNALGESIEWYKCSVASAEAAVCSGIEMFRESAQVDREALSDLDFSERVFNLLSEVFIKDPKLILSLRAANFDSVFAGLQDVLGSITNLESSSLVKVFGIDGFPCQTLHQFAYRNGISVQKSKNLYDSAIRKLRYPSRAVVFDRVTVKQ